MATFFSSSANQRDAAPMLYLREPLPGSYPEAPVLSNNMMLYSNSGSYSDALAGNSQQPSGCIEIPSLGPSNATSQQQEIMMNLEGSRAGEHQLNAWRDGRNEMLVMHSMGGPGSVFQDGQNLQGQGLSLSLSTQIPSRIEIHPIPYRSSTNPHFTSILGSSPSIPVEGNGPNGSTSDGQSRNVEYLPPSFSGANLGSGKGGLSQYGMSSIARTIPSSKYLKAAQQLLDEVVNVHKALKQLKSERSQSMIELRGRRSKEVDEKSNNKINELHSDAQEADGNCLNELSHAERQDLQNKLTKLFSMHDEVERRYKHYYHQMQIVVSSFDVIAGCGAAKPYTALALNTISCHFRCLRDAINSQIQATRRSLGEQDSSGNNKEVGIPRLRYVDQQLRQQRTLQQLGITQHTWRPQRGLPENSVSVLRAWLFEHFLHPYPKDSDKIMLARQTGLTRSQVSNWFINARVRLWKPMVEEMYKEEIGDAEIDSNSSTDNAALTIKGDVRTSDDQVEDPQTNSSSAATERGSGGQFTDSKSDNLNDADMLGTAEVTAFPNATHGEAETPYCVLKLSEEQRPSTDDCQLLPNAVGQSHVADNRFLSAATAYQMSEMGRFNGGSGVSLTLGLQHCEGGSVPFSVGTHDNCITVRGNDIYSSAATSVVVNTADFECMNTGDRQHRFSSSHLLRDFVA